MISISVRTLAYLLVLLFQCQGCATCKQPPENVINLIQNDETYAWDASDTQSTISSIAVGPGSLLGFVLERVGSRLLYGTKVSVVALKLFRYRLSVHSAALRPSLEEHGVIIQECVDILW